MMKLGLAWNTGEMLKMTKYNRVWCFLPYNIFSTLPRTPFHWTNHGNGFSKLIYKLRLNMNTQGKQLKCSLSKM
ncbi:hypothetical protein PRUPE_4G043400 [Prunus persica]|uniref:Uncharacterized protein n=1 Tax=Prunus persica TaxID=3760 RepID=A0A251PFK7_PRUPE|nr:hypothetical protein PRUPE_4G043400 [Prunus persica]